MEQNVNNNQTMNNNPDNGGKTFTQEQVNAIVGERLAKEKGKADAALAEREQQFAEREKELAKRELLFSAKEKIEKKGFSMELLEVLDISSEEALDKALNVIQEMIDKKISREFKVIPNRLPEGHHDTEPPLSKKLRNAMKAPD